MKVEDLRRLQSVGHFHEALIPKLDGDVKIINVYARGGVAHSVELSSVFSRAYDTRIELEGDGGCKVFMSLSFNHDARQGAIRALQEAKRTCSRVSVFCRQDGALLAVGPATIQSLDEDMCVFDVAQFSTAQEPTSLGTKLDSETMSRMLQLKLVEPTRGYDAGDEQVSNIYLREGSIVLIKLNGIVGSGRYVNAAYFDEATGQGVFKMPLTKYEKLRKKMLAILKDAMDTKHTFMVVGQIGQIFYVLGQATRVHSVCSDSCELRTEPRSTTEPRDTTAVGGAEATGEHSAQTRPTVLDDGPLEKVYDSNVEAGWHAFLQSIFTDAFEHPFVVQHMPTEFGGPEVSVYTPDLTVCGADLQIVRGWKSSLAIVEVKASFPMEDAKFKCEVVARRCPWNPVVLIYGTPTLPFAYGRQLGMDFMHTYRAIAYMAKADGAMDVRDSLVFVEDNGHIFLDEVVRTQDRRWDGSSRLDAAYAAAAAAMHDNRRAPKRRCSGHV